jgi:hypothetical protein
LGVQDLGQVRKNRLPEERGKPYGLQKAERAAAPVPNSIL